MAKHETMNKARIEFIAAMNGDDPDDYIVLSRSHDPFFVGAAGQVENATWFAEQWQRLGFGDGAHLRRVHYRLVSSDPKLVLPSGKPYENTFSCWTWLCCASEYARYLGLVNAADFADRRAPGMMSYWPRREGDPVRSVTGWKALTGDELVGLPEFPDTPYYTVTPFPVEQRYAVCVWCEKSGQGDILEPICAEYGANYVPGMGEMSITTVTQAVKRAERYGKPLRILYISDFDPAGADMPISVSRKLEFLAQGRTLDIRLEPIILTKEQVEQYHLPTTPLKEGERRMGDDFVNEKGERIGVELDALAGLYRDVFERIVREAIERYYDPTIAERAHAAQDEYQTVLDEQEVEVLARHQDELERLRARYDDLREHYDQALTYLRGVLAPIADDARRLWLTMGMELEDAAPPLPDLPEAREDDAPADELFDSTRDYFAQLAVYKARQRPRKTNRATAADYRSRNREKVAAAERARRAARREAAGDSGGHAA